MKVRWDPPPPGRGPSVRLPGRGLWIGWGAVSALAITFWLVATVHPEQGSGLLGSGLAIAVMGGGLFILKPWLPRHASDLPTAWLSGAVVRVLVLPAAAFLLYFAIRPMAMPFVLGIVTVYLALLCVEVGLLALALHRQRERSAPAEE
jgi:hypothetical protein